MPEQEFGELNQARANRVGAWIVLFVGGVGAIFGLWFLYAQIAHSSQRTAAYKSLDQLEQEKISAMKSQDTDRDTLSDYDETYVYRTNPYLSDSDGDNVPDAAELKNGSNPNCPEGQRCGPLGNSVTTPASTGTPADETTTSTAAEEAAIQSMMNPTAAQVRQMLLDSGLKPADIAGIDDATLLQMYRASLSEAQVQNQK